MQPFKVVSKTKFDTGKNKGWMVVKYDDGHELWVPPGYRFKE